MNGTTPRRRRNTATPGNEIDLPPAMTGILISWYRMHARDFPWRNTTDPYRVWLSEVMLQQTRAEAARPYYNRFLSEIPTIGALAETDDEKLFKLWEGLGYYARARNLRAAARVVTGTLGGRFPQTYEEIRKLPGIGPYTAGAIASICFDEPTPAVDGNVLRVVSRVAACGLDMDTPAARGAVTRGVARIYPDRDRGAFSQALMELGATMCIPNGHPRCGTCPLGHLCLAHLRGDALSYPVRREKRPRRTVELTVLLLVCGGEMAISRRPDAGLLAGMWEFPNREGQMSEKEATALAAAWGSAPLAVSGPTAHTHVFTHVTWRITCYRVVCGARPDRFLWADEATLSARYALPTAFKICLSRENPA